MGLGEKMDLIQNILNKTKSSKNSTEDVTKMDIMAKSFNLTIANHADCRDAMIELGKAIQQFRIFLGQNNVPKLSDVFDSFVSILELFLPCTNRLKIFNVEIFDNDNFSENAMCTHLSTVLFLLTKLAENLALYLKLIVNEFNPSVVVTLLVTSILAKLLSSILGFYILAYLDPCQRDGCFKLCHPKACTDQINALRGIIGKIRTFANINSARILVDHLSILLKLVENTCNSMINNFLTLLNLFLIYLLETLALINDQDDQEFVLDIFLYNVANFLQNLHVVTLQFNLRCTKDDACNVSCFNNDQCKTPCIPCCSNVKRSNRRCFGDTILYPCVGKFYPTMYPYK
ncbi:MAG: hypothetical protein QW303_00295 [Nitrososphaerota archaeon]